LLVELLSKESRLHVSITERPYFAFLSIQNLGFWRAPRPPPPPSSFSPFSFLLSPFSQAPMTLTLLDLDLDRIFHSDRESAME
jgi:hypothetical protein